LYIIEFATKLLIHNEKGEENSKKTGQLHQNVSA